MKKTAHIHKLFWCMSRLIGSDNSEIYLVRFSLLSFFIFVIWRLAGLSQPIKLYKTYLTSGNEALRVK